MKLESLPAGEQLLWQGRPAWWPLAIRAFHVRKVAIYFAVFTVWRFAAVFADGAGLIDATIAALWMLAPAGAAVAVLCGLAWIYARSTRYSITSKRVLLQFGVALPMTFNVPFRIVGSAGLKVYSDGTGDIPLALTGKDRIAYLLLWPNVRPGRFARTEPMLRAVPDIQRVAETLAQALIAATNGPKPPVADEIAASSAQSASLAAVAA